MLATTAKNRWMRHVVIRKLPDVLRYIYDGLEFQAHGSLPMSGPQPYEQKYI
jgi:hypothetical protein